MPGCCLTAHLHIAEGGVPCALPGSRPPAAAAGSSSAAEAEEGLPFRAFLRNTPVRALAYTHFCNNWCALFPGSALPEQSYGKQSVLIHLLLEPLLHLLCGSMFHGRLERNST